MGEKEINHLIVASIINLFLMVLLIRTAWSGNDKAILLVIFYYPLLIPVNLISWLTLSARRKTQYKAYRLTTIALILLFLPVLMIASMY